MKRRANLTGQQRFRLRDLLRYNLRTARAYLLKEELPAVLGVQVTELGWQVPG